MSYIFLSCLSTSCNACANTCVSEILSPDNISGRLKGASAPPFIAAFAISSLSVETTILSINSTVDATCEAISTIGTPPTFFKFFKGIPLLPPLAGITARTFNLLTIIIIQ